MMRIGSRWRVGETPPAGLPEAFLAAVDAASVADGWWTLTWLEGRPVAEHEDGTRLALGADGEVRSGADDGAEPELDDDDWLA